MTTKEEVLRLCAAANVYFFTNDTVTRISCVTGVDEITKLIELAKQAGAAEEREACAKWAAGWFDNHPEDIAEAIRNRAANPNQTGE